MNPWIWIACFAGMFAVDVCWVWYMKEANEDKPHGAAFWALLLHGFGAANAVFYTDDPRYISATLLGTYWGTYAVVRYKRAKARREVAAMAEKAARDLDGIAYDGTEQGRRFALGNLAASDSASAGAREWAKAELAKLDDPGDTVPAGAKVVEDDGS